MYSENPIEVFTCESNIKIQGSFPADVVIISNQDYLISRCVVMESNDFEEIITYGGSLTFRQMTVHLQMVCYDPFEVGATF